jgi:hypothetical protein
VSWAKTDPLVAARHSRFHPPLHRVTGQEPIDPSPPLTVTPDPVAGHNIINATVWRREEKGPDVNVASHLLRDVFTGAVQLGRAHPLSTAAHAAAFASAPMPGTDNPPEVAHRGNDCPGCLLVRAGINLRGLCPDRSESS